jgi:transposase
MDGEALFCRSSQRCGGGDRGRHVTQSSSQAVWGRDQHGDWMQRVEQTGSVAPGQMGGHKPKAISGEHAVWLSQRIRAGDFTLRGLVAELGERRLKVDYRSVWEFVHAEKLSFKKKRGGWRTRSARRGAAARPVDKVSRPRRT